MIWIFFHGSMACMDLFVLLRLQRRPGAKLYGQLFGLTWIVLAGLVLACTFLVDDDIYFGAHFMTLGALAQGIFVHAPCLLILSGCCLRKPCPWLARGSIALGLLTLCVGYYAFWIEPTRLERNQHRVESAKLSAPMRLVVISDLQLEELGEYEKRAIRAALAEEPDVLLLPGDFIHARAGENYLRLKAELNAFLRAEKFGARLGVIAVSGNVDYADWPGIFEGLDVRCFRDSGSLEWEGVHFSALDFRDSGNARLQLAGQSGFHVALGHLPDFALGEVQADLLVAGHTHGGQVVLPFFGPPITLTQVPRDWASGRTEIAPGRSLLVSRGVGMERGYAPRLRFGCPPEILVIHLVPRAGKP